jgi:hypothetical protein
MYVRCPANFDFGVCDQPAVRGDSLGLAISDELVMMLGDRAFPAMLAKVGRGLIAERMSHLDADVSKTGGRLSTTEAGRRRLLRDFEKGLLPAKRAGAKMLELHEAIHSLTKHMEDLSESRSVICRPVEGASRARRMAAAFREALEAGDLCVAAPLSRVLLARVVIHQKSRIDVEYLVPDEGSEAAPPELSSIAATNGLVVPELQPGTLTYTISYRERDAHSTGSTEVVVRLVTGAEKRRPVKRFMCDFQARSHVMNFFRWYAVHRTAPHARGRLPWVPVDPPE